MKLKYTDVSKNRAFNIYLYFFRGKKVSTFVQVLLFFGLLINTSKNKQVVNSIHALVL